MSFDKTELILDALKKYNLSDVLIDKSEELLQNNDYENDFDSSNTTTMYRFKESGETKEFLSELMKRDTLY